MSLTRRLAAFAVSGDTPAGDALAMMRLSVFDWAACAIAGAGEPVSVLLRDLVTREGGTGEALALGTQHKIPARAAALLGGVASHALDYDDTHFAHIGHPSVAVVPAALAMAQRQASSGAAFLRASLIGAELSVRVGIWLGRAHYQRGFHQTGTAGCFGAAAAAGLLLGLDEGRMAQALGLASTKAAGLKSQFGTMGKPYNAGQAAMAGVEVALLAGAGFVSNPDALEAAQGFGETHHGEADMAALCGLGRDWCFEQVSHKFHACCHGTHAMIEALRSADCPRDQIAQVLVRTHPRWMSVCNQMRPQTGLEAKFSYRLIAALVLLGHDTAALDTFRDDLVADASVVALRDRVDVLGDQTVGEMQSRVEITLQSGERLTVAHDLAAPISLETRRDRLRAKAAALLGSQRAEQLAQAVLCGAAPDLDLLLDVLRAQ